MRYLTVLMLLASIASASATVTSGGSYSFVTASGKTLVVHDRAAKSFFSLNS